MFDIKKIKDSPEDEILKTLIPQWYEKPFLWIKRIFKNLKRVFSWTSLIWKDREWDYNYLEKIILFKLKRMRDYYQNSEETVSIEANLVADEINEVIEVLERIEEDNYEELIDPKFNNWIKDEKREVFITKIDENGKEYSTFNFPEFTEEERNQRNNTYANAEKMRQADYNKAYGLIAKNIRKWWD